MPSWASSEDTFFHSLNTEGFTWLVLPSRASLPMDHTDKRAANYIELYTWVGTQSRTSFNEITLSRTLNYVGLRFSPVHTVGILKGLHILTRASHIRWDCGWQTLHIAGPCLASHKTS